MSDERNIHIGQGANGNVLVTGDHNVVVLVLDAGQLD
jgi:hypothetical protein